MGAAAFPPPVFECARSVTTQGVEGMSRRSYVFLHRIHPHSILIGSSLSAEEKRRNRGERRNESRRAGGWGRSRQRLPRVSAFTSPAMPSHLCGLNNEVRRWSVFVLSVIEQLPDDSSASRRNPATTLTLKPSPSD